MTGHVQDLWTRPGPPDSRGRATRIRTDRWGRGKRWQARWIEDGHEKAKVFASKDAAEAFVARVAIHGPEAPRAKVTFGEYFETWRKSQLHHRLNTVRNVEVAYRIRIAPQL